MKLNFIVISCIAAALTLGGCQSNQKKAAVKVDTTDNWAILPFTKLDSVNPVLGPGRGNFIDPILKTKVLWEAKDVFNPAIVNRGGKIWMLYRAQDSTGNRYITHRFGRKYRCHAFCTQTNTGIISR
jgi:hypothetical protein